MSCAFDFLRNYWFRCFLRRVMVILLQQKNFGPNVIYFVLGTLVIVARLTYSWPNHCLLLRDWRILDAEIGKTLENRRTSAKPWPSRPTGGAPGRLKQPRGYPPPPPAPLCMFLLLPKFFELLLKVSYFFLSILFGLQRLSKITFCGPWTYLHIHLYSLVWHSALIFFFTL